MLSRKFLIPLFLFSVSGLCHAGTGMSSKDSKTLAPAICDPLAQGTTELEVLGGYFHSPFLGHKSSRPQFDYAGVDVRFGAVVTPKLFTDCAVLRGNVELLVDALADGVTKGAGNFLAGGSLLVRYNFLPSCRLIPYVQIGAGGLKSDAAEDRSQRLIGGNIEFILSADLGLRFVLNEHWSLLLEGGFQHISNADTQSRNVGVNAIGGRLGLGYIF